MSKTAIMTLLVVAALCAGVGLVGRRLQPTSATTAALHSNAERTEHSVGPLEVVENPLRQDIRDDRRAAREIAPRELTGTWRPVLTEEAKYALLHALGASADDPRFRTSLERTQRELERREIRIDATSITISQPGVAPVRQPYRLVDVRGQRAELMTATPGGGAPHRVELQLIEPDELRATLSGAGQGVTMTLRRVAP